ncbi:uncharacterized protein [Prorops nasuta]|uniref:uncharacterized protein n=1 Tax=Prorops nasuta TaxID=863751 RepID=UPI0034CFD15B
MSDKIKLLIQKRIALKTQLTTLNNILEKGTVDTTALNLRMKRISELYKAFEDFNDELSVLDPKEDHQVEFIGIQERYYNIASRIENLLEASTNKSDNSNTISTEGNEREVQNSLIKRRKLKLPEITLPVFDGKYENWLTFKNMFKNIIGTQNDLTDTDKLHYLKAALIEDAAQKIGIFTISDINFNKAWELLEKSYEVKRILISQHLSLILELPVMNKDSTNAYSKLADDMQQHIAALDALGVKFTPELTVHILETKLTKSALKEWETNLERDEFPTLDKMYEFLYKSAVCASRRERVRHAEAEKAKPLIPDKKRKFDANHKSFFANATNNCVVCNKSSHPLFKCDEFKALSVDKRIEAVRAARVCYNCLRSHRGKQCRASTCSKCHKRHNTLIHVEVKGATTNDTKEAAQSM